jgi:hypothetical protein
MIFPHVLNMINLKKFGDPQVAETNNAHTLIAPLPPHWNYKHIMFFLRQINQFSR